MSNVLPVVTIEHAEICADFLIDQAFNGEPVAVPLGVNRALKAYEATSPADLPRRPVAELAELRNEIQWWLVEDRDACVAVLGPGLGIDQ